jgi:class 3 adenylate cyclase
MRVLDSPPEERFDRLTRLAAKIYKAPISVCSLVDEKRQWFKSTVGLNASETSREISFCGHAILGDDLFVIEDASKDWRFFDNPLVAGEPFIRFYAGAPLRLSNGAALGTLCIIDHKPRKLLHDELKSLRDIARIAERELEAVMESAMCDNFTRQPMPCCFSEMATHHRTCIAALFCDLRGFTAFSEMAEPEEVMNVLQDYHQVMGRLICNHGGTIDHRAGDGIMVIFNDPIPCDYPALAAVQLALTMREEIASLCDQWNRLGYQLGFGAGISLGYATLGVVGHEGHYDYTANGSSVNLAARLADVAQDRQILLSQRAHTAIEGSVPTKPFGEIELKGFSGPSKVFMLL